MESSLSATWTKKAKKTEFDFNYGQQLKIINRFDFETSVTLEVNGRRTTVEDVKDEFEAANIAFPRVLPAWKGDHER